MDYGVGRPISLEQHPLYQQNYIIPTPSIDVFYERVKKCVRLRTPGAIIYSHPRFGKTYGTRYVTRVLGEDFERVVVFSFLCHKKGQHSESAFFSNLLESVGHKTPSSGSISAKRSRLINFIKDRVDRSRQSIVVFFADEAQRLSIIEYEWLRDVHDELDKRGIRMITFLVGQHELRSQKNALRQAKQAQIVARFMIDELQFRGLLSVDDFATCLNGYDESCFPLGSDWSYTRYFLPKAYAGGFRLLSQAGTMWEAFVTAHQSARFKFDVEVPMQYFARAVEIALLDNIDNDSADFCMSPAIWSEAVREARYVEAQTELHLILQHEMSSALD